MLRRLDSLLEKLLNLIGRNKLLTKIGKKVLFSHYIKRGLERICRFYAVARFKEGLDPFLGGYYSRPRFNLPPKNFNVKISEENLLIIKRILDKEGLRYWLALGTFLGAYRDKALIPYDEDTDLAIYSEDVTRLVRCEDEFTQAGFYLGLSGGMVTLYREGEHTDLYRFHLEGAKRRWNGVAYDVSAFETFNEIEFLGQEWRILADPERWLRYTYGEDWETPIKGKGIRGCAYGEEFRSNMFIEPVEGWETPAMPGETQGTGLA